MATQSLTFSSTNLPIDGNNVVAANVNDTMNAFINDYNLQIGANKIADGVITSQQVAAHTLTEGDVQYGVFTLLHMVAGIVQMFAGATAPTGSLICDGSAVSRTTYAALFAVIGTIYGVGDGSSTFNLPDLRDKFPIGESATKTLGASGGASTVNLSHAHIAINVLSTGEWKDGDSSHFLTAIHQLPTQSAGNEYMVYSGPLSRSSMTSLQLSSAQSIQNPYLALNFIITTGGV